MTITAFENVSLGNALKISMAFYVLLFAHINVRIQIRVEPRRGMGASENLNFTTLPTSG